MSVDVCTLCLITAPLWTIKLWTGTTWSLTPQLQTVSHNIMIVSSNLSQSKANSLWCHSFWWLLRSPMIGSYIGRVPNGSQIREHCAQSIQLHSTMIKLYPLHFTRTEWPLPLRPAWPTWKQNCYTLTDSNTRQFTHDTFMIPHDTHRPRLPKTAASHRCLNDAVHALLEVHKSSLVWQVWEINLKGLLNHLQYTQFTFVNSIKQF